MTTLSQTDDVGNNKSESKTENAFGTVSISRNNNNANEDLRRLFNSETVESLEEAATNTVSRDSSENVFSVSFLTDSFPVLDDELNISTDEIGDSQQDGDQIEQMAHVDRSSFTGNSPGQGDGSIGSGSHRDTAVTSPESVTQNQADDSPHLCVDRRETLLSPTAKATLSKHLLEDVISSKARAEQLVAHNPEASHRQVIHDFNSSSPEPTLTPAGHLMSELGLLETSARDQRDSLQVALQQHQIYLRELHLLTHDIDEAQKKLQESSVSAESVGKLRQLMTERTDLTEQIKRYNIEISEVNEKIRQLALDSAQLSPSVFRKHYHPESAYSDYFAATAQNKRVVPVHSPGQLFYDSLPEFDFHAFSDEDSVLSLARLTQDELEERIQSEHQNSEHCTTPISLELPRLIPPPRTDSIPRPTWSGEILSTATSSDMSRGTSVSHSIDSPRTMAKAFEASASTSKSVGLASVLAQQTTESCNSTITAEAGPEMLQSADASNTDITDTGTGESSCSLLHHDTFSSPVIDSEVSYLTLAPRSSQKESPDGGQQTGVIASSEYFPETNESPSTGRTSTITLAQLDTGSEAQDDWSQQATGARVTPNVQALGPDSPPSISRISPHGQDAKERNQKGSLGVETCKKQIDDVKNWLEKNIGQQLSMPLSLEKQANLQTQLLENKDIQEQISKQMQKLSELILQCDSLSSEDSIAAQQLLADLLALQRDLEQAKQAAIEKQLMLEAAVSEAVDSGEGRAN
ncbi:unnamed protein product, partial [Candidula unifasciata]